MSIDNDRRERELEPCKQEILVSLGWLLCSSGRSFSFLESRP